MPWGQFSSTLPSGLPGPTLYFLRPALLCCVCCLSHFSHCCDQTSDNKQLRARCGSRIRRLGTLHLHTGSREGPGSGVLHESFPAAKFHHLEDPQPPPNSVTRWGPRVDRREHGVYISHLPQQLVILPRLLAWWDGFEWPALWAIVFVWVADAKTGSSMQA